MYVCCWYMYINVCVCQLLYALCPSKNTCMDVVMNLYSIIFYSTIIYHIISLYYIILCIINYIILLFYSILFRLVVYNVYI